MDRDFPKPRIGLRPFRWGALLLTSVASVVTCLPGDAHALGVGRPLTQSSLGQALNLLFPVRLIADETLTTECVRADVVAGEARLPTGLLQLQLEGEDEGNVRAVRLRSLVQIDEPIVMINLSLGCPVRLTRQFTAFIDPPNGMAPAPSIEAAIIEPASVQPALRPYSQALRAALSAVEAKPTALLVQGEATRAAVDASAPPSVARASAPAAGRTGPSAQSSGAAISATDPNPPTAKKPRRSKRLDAAAPLASQQAGAASGKGATAASPRLRLDPPEALELPVMAVAAAPASSPELVAALDRLQKLEQDLAKVQQDHRSTENRLLALRAQLEAAQQGRYANPLVIGLGLLVLSLGAGCFYLWRSRKGERELRESAWWNEIKKEQREQHLDAAAGDPSKHPTGGATVSTTTGTTTGATRGPTVEGAPLPVPRSLTGVQPEENTLSGALIDADERTLELPSLLELDEPQPPAAPEHEPLTVQFMQTQPPGAAAAPLLEPSRAHLSVEELIDLEQQVVFFEVLGQDSAAIELLQRRIGGGAVSALLYLHLLEIYQRRADQEAFADLAQSYAQRFGVAAPPWGGDLKQGRGLDGYGGVVSKVQVQWRDSGASMALLQRLLSQGMADQDGSGGFDLPAYRDLLLLYTVARDLSEHEVRGEEIDLFLPLDADAGSATLAHMATMVWQSTPVPTGGRRIELDISLDEPATETR